MPKSSFQDFMASDAGAYARYKARRQKRIGIPVFDIEPQSKRMSGDDRKKFQEAVVSALENKRRRAFKGDVALKLELATTRRDAPQAHTIAKNLLDLLGKKRTDVKGPSQNLLYADDRQIQALFVSCHHGNTHPSMLIEARPFPHLIDDLELATKAIHDPANQYDQMMKDDMEDDWVDTYRKLRKEEKQQRERLGDRFYEVYSKFVRGNAQKALLKKTAVNIPMLGWLYGLRRGIPMGFSKDMWIGMVKESKGRLQIGGLPIATGDGDRFKASVAAEIEAFKIRWAWILDPLDVAVALEVIVQPNWKTPRAVLHDLDNVVRDYLLPGIVPKFRTVTDQRWTVDFNSLAEKHPELGIGSFPMPPPGTKRGVTRYEAWRLPAEKGEDGFVSVALVADMDAEGDRIHQIDDRIKQWSERTFGDDRRRRRR
jgi:hypothetical protein